MNYIALDCEFNKGVSTRLIQIGAVAGNIYTGEIFEELSNVIAVDEPIDPFIVTLTGITDERVAKEGVALRQAYLNLRSMKERHLAQAHPIVWGSGDPEAIKRAVMAECPDLISGQAHWCFGYRWIDVKTIYQWKALASHKKPQAGLAKAMTKMGMRFLGSRHDAKDDSRNTFRLAHFLLQMEAKQELRKGVLSEVETDVVPFKKRIFQTEDKTWVDADYVSVLEHELKQMRKKLIVSSV